MVDYKLDNVFIEPGRVYSPKHFVMLKQPGSIGFDGIVSGNSFIDYRERYANFDHHNDLDVPSTCKQVFYAIKNDNFIARFTNNGQLEIYLYENHIDEDAIKANHSIKNPELVLADASNGHRLETLVLAEDQIDRSAGTKCTVDLALKQNMAWIFWPYHDARYSKKLFDMNDSQKKEIILEVFNRIDAYAVGKADKCELKNDYKILQKEKGKHVAIIEEYGPWSRIKAVEDGIHTAISVIEQNPNRYIFWTINDNLRSRLKTIEDELNKEEILVRQSRADFKNFKTMANPVNMRNQDLLAKIDEGNKWGGGPNFTASPRMGGSFYERNDLFQLIDNLMTIKYEQAKNKRKLLRSVATIKRMFVLPF